MKLVLCCMLLAMVDGSRFLAQTRRGALNLVNGYMKQFEHTVPHENSEEVDEMDLDHITCNFFTPVINVDVNGRCRVVENTTRKYCGTSLLRSMVAINETACHVVGLLCEAVYLSMSRHHGVCSVDLFTGILSCSNDQTNQRGTFNTCRQGPVDFDSDAEPFDPVSPVRYRYARHIDSQPPTPSTRRINDS